jgi:hypothetical protein
MGCRILVKEVVGKPARSLLWWHCVTDKSKAPFCFSLFFPSGKKAQSTNGLPDGEARMKAGSSEFSLRTPGTKFSIRWDH